MRTLLALLALPFAAFAQAEAIPVEAQPAETKPVAETPPVPLVTTPPWNQPQPEHQAVPVLRNWNLGAGLSFLFPNVGFTGLSGLAGLTGGLSGSGLSAGPVPRLTLLIERRLSERVFLTFNGGIGYAGSQSVVHTAVSSRTFSFDASAGVRGIFNPGGVVEVSGFGSVTVGYNNYESRNLIPLVDSSGASMQVPSTTLGSGFSIGGLAGLALERELIPGLALRLSSSILGFGFNTSESRTTVQDSSTSNGSRGGDVGLRLNPAIELRYAL